MMICFEYGPYEPLDLELSIPTRAHNADYPGFMMKVQPKSFISHKLPS